MSNSVTLAAHLPYLRRFARALAGTQKAGDAFATATLETILQDPACLASDLDPRTAMLRVLLKIWLPVTPDVEPALAPDKSLAADRHLEAMTPLPRAAFLLHSMEGMSIERVAAALDIDVEEANQLIEQAGHEIAEQISTDVLIIEDEPLIAMDIEGLVNELGHRVAAVCATRHEAVAAVRHHRPGLVLADIRLADGSSGLDAVNEILDMFDVPVVFITAYPEQLLTGERPEPAFLITKPFRPSTAQAIISQALFFDTKAHRRRAPAAV